MGIANMVGQISWMIVPLFWVLIANKDLFDSQADGVRTLSLFVGFACLIFGILPAIFCKELDVSDARSKANLTIKDLAVNMKILWENMKNMTKNNPFMRLCGATFLVFNGFQMVASFSYFIIVFHMYKGSYEMAGTVPAIFSILGAFITAVLIIPIVSWLANKYGKRNAFIISTFLSLIGYALKWWGFVVVDENTTVLFKDVVLQLGVVKFSVEIPLILLLPVPFMAFGLGGLFTLMMSMTADVCDLDELKNGLPRREGTFGAVYWWMVKIGQSIALALGGLVLSLVGFDQNIAQQTHETLTSLRIADIIIPVTTAALAVWVMWNYDLNEEKAKEIRAELVKKRSEL
jgi:GPH family glycoside/pentoside/hexuronide:cation symporter